jgi:hypothetical protein
MSLLEAEGKTMGAQVWLKRLPHLGTHPIQSPNPDTIVDANKCMLTEA